MWFGHIRALEFKMWNFDLYPRDEQLIPNGISIYAASAPAEIQAFPF